MSLVWTCRGRQEVLEVHKRGSNKGSLKWYGVGFPEMIPSLRTLRPYKSTHFLRPSLASYDPKFPLQF